MSMRRNVFACLLLVTGLIAVHGGSAQADPPQPPRPPNAAAPKDCIKVRGEASFASVGYDHLVHVSSSCPKPMSCSVKTNVNPDATVIEVAPNQTQTVVTWRGSPAREFTPIVSCSQR
jgi:hypothetical protein